uniref:mTERF transcription factor n=1 Tax=Zea mays TaxID=4577 RepID=A0A804M6H2_MAIZE
MLRVRNRLLPLLGAASPLPSPIHIHLRVCRLLSTSTSTATVPAPFSLENYLVAACGFAPAQARLVSKKAFNELSRESKRSSEEHSCRRLISASNPDAILALLSGAGLSRADIAAVVFADPLILRASVSKIAPRLVALRDRVGLSTPQIARFLLVGSRALRRCDVVPKVEFFLSFLGSFDRVLAVAKANLGIFNANLEKEFLLRAEELGVPAASPLFMQAVGVVTSFPPEKVAAKLDFFKRTLGCSESEVSNAVSKMPQILALSEATLLRKIEFLVNEGAIEPQYIMQRPILLAFSLEKRLVPRYRVIKVLQGKGLLNSNMSLSSLASLAEETFKSKFVDCHKDCVPGLADAYAAACASIVPSTV